MPFGLAIVTSVHQRKHLFIIASKIPTLVSPVNYLIHDTVQSSFSDASLCSESNAPKSISESLYCLH